MPTRIAILGFAHGHVGMYCDQWLKRPADEVALVAGWDHDAGRAAQNCEKFKLQRATTIDELVTRKDVDAVVIGVETSMHAEAVEKAAAAGKAIVLQKPLCLTLADADRIVNAVERSKARFTLAWQMRTDPQNIRMKQLIAEKTLGRVFMIRRRHGLSTHVWGDWFENSWHVKPELNRGMWADDAAHPIDWLLWTLGEPVSVVAEIDTLRTPKVPDDNGVAIFRYEDGTIAHIDCSFTCVAGVNTTEIVGEKGVAIQDFGDGPSAGAPRTTSEGLRWYLQESKQWVPSGIASPGNHGERIAGLAGPLLEFLQGKRPSIATAQEGRTALRMTLACYESARLGRRVRIDQVR